MNLITATKVENVRRKFEPGVTAIVCVLGFALSLQLTGLLRLLALAGFFAES